MKSKVKFDLDDENDPIIVAEIENSEDLRDKVAKKFSDKLGFSSKYCRSIFHNRLDKTEIHITPIGSSLEELNSFRDEINTTIKALEDYEEMMRKGSEALEESKRIYKEKLENE